MARARCCLAASEWPRGREPAPLPPRLLCRLECALFLVQGHRAELPSVTNQGAPSPCHKANSEPSGGLWFDLWFNTAQHSLITLCNLSRPPPAHPVRPHALTSLLLHPLTFRPHNRLSFALFQFCWTFPCALQREEDPELAASNTAPRSLRRLSGAIPPLPPS
ncbi:hypothetical protein VTI74DRAFT_9256 [Chaetomium olivicolor]